jgi:hypothetical protein
MTNPEQIHVSEGYVNLENGDAFKGKIHVYPNYVTIFQNGTLEYTIRRRNVDFINWKPV